jgi:uncharacterized protein YndB with AHSA1/START domain
MIAFIREEYAEFRCRVSAGANGRAFVRKTHHMATSITSGLLLALAVPALCHADVTASGPSGFALKIETPIAAAPADVYGQFLKIGQWWSSEHTYSGKAANMSIENTPGGCFCETLPGGGFVRHGSVEYSVPGKSLRLSAALGPLQEMGAFGLMSLRFQADGTKTRLVMIYTVTGYEPTKGYGEIAPAVNGVINEQLLRLKRLAETGKPGA